MLSSPSRFYLPVNAVLIPTGEIAAGGGTGLDFTTPEADRPGHRDGRGRLRPLPWSSTVAKPGLALACRASDPRSGRGMEVWTTLPAFQLYSGNFLDGRTGAGGRVFAKHAAFCIEPEFFPTA